MGKTSGGNRILKTGSREYRRRGKEVEEMLASGKYSSVSLSVKGGGYVAIEKSPAKHKPEEIEAATILANRGYKVILKNEAGQTRTPDGELFSISFEQRTLIKNAPTTIRNALFHAQEKGADIAVIYSKGKMLSRKSIEGGIKLYEDLGKYRFKMVIIVSDRGKIHRYKHNK